MRTSYKTSASALRTIVCDGNSVTAGAGGTPYPNQLNDLLRIHTVVNTGVSGKTTQQLIDDFSTKVVPRYVPGAELIWFEQYNSFNPFNGNVSVSTEQTLVRTYVAQAQAAGFKVWICTPTPTSDSDINDKITEYSTWLRSNHSFANGGFIDLNAAAAFTPPGQVANPSHFFDSVHLTSKGYAVLAATVFAGITG